MMSCLNIKTRDGAELTAQLNANKQLNLHMYNPVTGVSHSGSFPYEDLLQWARAWVAAERTNETDFNPSVFPSATAPRIASESVAALTPSGEMTASVLFRLEKYQWIWDFSFLPGGHRKGEMKIAEDVTVSCIDWGPLTVWQADSSTKFHALSFELGVLAASQYVLEKYEKNLGEVSAALSEK